MPENVTVTIELLDGPYYVNHWNYGQYRIEARRTLSGGIHGERRYRDSLEEAEEVKKELEEKYAIRKGTI